jgi:hypothetical protein
MILGTMGPPLRKESTMVLLICPYNYTRLYNNICESALRKAVIHRNNSLFYKTEHGAEVGDGFMSLIHTCRLNGEDPFHYLTELQLHHKELAASPKDWMPWNYRDTLARIKKS